MYSELRRIAGRYLGKGQQVAIEGRLQTRSWDDERGLRHWKTEIVASHVEMLSGRRKKDYEAQQAADLKRLTAMLNDVDWSELGFVCDGRFLFSQRSLEQALLPEAFAEFAVKGLV